MPHHKNIAFYIRLSNEDTDLKSTTKSESNSITNQRELLESYYHANPDLAQYKIITFCDDGYTGTNFNRPQFTLMMQMIKQGDIQCVIVKDLSRFGRNFLEVSAYLELILPIYGIRFISVNDGFDSIRYIGTTGGLELALRNLINSLYSQDLSVKVKTAFKTRAKQGLYTGSSPFYGYLLDPHDRNKLIINSELVPIIQQIYNCCIEGMSATKIATMLNNEGIPSPAEYKKAHGLLYNGRSRIHGVHAIWFPSTVLSILKDERYTGKLITNRREFNGIRATSSKALPKENWIIVQGTHKPIISQQTFDKARNALSSRASHLSKSSCNGASKNIFYCGYCGRKLYFDNRKSKYLTCPQSHVDPNCQCVSIHESVESIRDKSFTVVKALATTILEQSSSYGSSLQITLNNSESQIRTIESQIAKLKSKRLELYESYKLGAISKEAFLREQGDRQSMLDTLVNKKCSLEEKISECKQEQRNMLETLENANKVEALSGYDSSVISIFIRKIRLYGNGRIELDLNSNDNLLQIAIEHTTLIAASLITEQANHQ